MTRKRILVVDDEIGSTRLLKANLELTNLYEVWVENRPENTVRTASRFKPHLVLLDVVMPHMSGVDVAKALRGEPGLESIPIALMTAADKSFLSLEVDPSINSLPRIAKPASMEKILQFLEDNLPMLPEPGSTARFEPAKT
jgi:CheY-like chemotaxis protein